MNQNKLALFVNLIIIQFFTMVIVSYYEFFWNFESVKKPSLKITVGILFLVFLIFIIISIYIVKELFYLSQRETEAKLAQQKLEDSNKMIQTLKAYQHDFLNHLQVISLAAQTGNTELINKYTKGIVKQVNKLESLSNLKLPEVAALIYSKISEAEEAQIKVNVNINTNLQGIKIEAIDLVRLLGNLIDNAIFELKVIDILERELNILLCEEKDSFRFEIGNLRPVIPDSQIDKIFERGFTTKGDKGSGIGLYNVKNIVNKYHGAVKVSSDFNEGTIFEVIIPKVFAF